MRTAVITLVAGRHEHLRRQLEALDPRVHHVVVAMGEGEVERCRELLGDGGDVIGVDATADGLPLAHARNAGAAHALASGAELLVFLDVDCIPSATLLIRYETAAHATPDALLCGPVGYLPPGADGDLHALAKPHPARPVPHEDELIPGGDHALFWTLSFAVTPATWKRVGGFCEAYVGYGGEDTDYGQLAARAGTDLVWVGGAWAYHQHHATQSPPTQHLHDIVRNGGIFKSRWGWWPMGGWLAAFAERGLVRHDAATDHWVLV